MPTTPIIESNVTPTLVASRTTLPPEGALAPWGGPAALKASPFIYLASQSPRRRQLLEQLGVRYELLLPDEAEDAEGIEAVLPNEVPATYVQRVTGLKLDLAVQRLKRRGLPPAPILCSDTTVALGRQIYGKPADERDAERMLAELAGHTHRVLTAVAVGGARKCEQALSISRVSFAPLSPREIKRYVASGEPLGKAGAYAVQGRAAVFISKISGSYTGIMGLPLFETAQLLNNFGFKQTTLRDRPLALSPSD